MVFHTPQIKSSSLVQHERPLWFSAPTFDFISHPSLPSLLCLQKYSISFCSLHRLNSVLTQSLSTWLFLLTEVFSQADFSLYLRFCLTITLSEKAFLPTLSRLVSLLFFFFFFLKRKFWGFLKNLFIYLFIFGCVGSAFLCEGFL